MSTCHNTSEGSCIQYEGETTVSSYFNFTSWGNTKGVFYIYIIKFTIVFMISRLEIHNPSESYPGSDV